MQTPAGCTVARGVAGAWVPAFVERTTRPTSSTPPATAGVSPELGLRPSFEPLATPGTAGPAIALSMAAAFGVDFWKKLSTRGCGV